MQVGGQQAGEDACGVQRLQQVVHGGCDKAGFVAVGTFCILLGLRQIVRAFGNALLQRVGQIAQLARGVFVAGDVGVAGDKAAVGQWVATNLQHRAVALGAFMQMRAAAAQVLQPALYGLIHIALAQQAALGVVAYQGLNGLAHMHQLGWVAK